MPVAHANREWAGLTSGTEYSAVYWTNLGRVQLCRLLAHGQTSPPAQTVCLSVSWLNLVWVQLYTKQRDCTVVYDVAYPFHWRLHPARDACSAVALLGPGRGNSEPQQGKTRSPKGCVQAQCWPLSASPSLTPITPDSS